MNKYDAGKILLTKEAVVSAWKCHVPRVISGNAMVACIEEMKDLVTTITNKNDDIFKHESKDF